MRERVYLDSAPIIDSVERVERFAAIVVARVEAPGIVRVTSELTRMECRVKPLREADFDRLRDFDDFFESSISETVGLTRAVLELATDIRARYGYKTPDAIHICGGDGIDLRRILDQRPATRPVHGYPCRVGRVQFMMPPPNPVPAS